MPPRRYLLTCAVWHYAKLLAVTIACATVIGVALWWFTGLVYHLAK
jgi:hypothetical protein